MDSKKLALLCRKLADDKKAEDIVVLDLRKISSVTDYFVICTGTSEPHLRAIVDEITGKLREEHSQRPAGTDGTLQTSWVVIDYFDVIVHVMREDLRRAQLVVVLLRLRSVRVCMSRRCKQHRHRNQRSHREASQRSHHPLQSKDRPSAPRETTTRVIGFSARLLRDPAHATVSSLNVRAAVHCRRGNFCCDRPITNII